MRVGLFTHAEQRAQAAGKYFYPNLDGTLGSRTNGSLVRCDYQTAQVTSLAELAEWLPKATASQYLTQGTSQHTQATVYYKERATELGDTCPQSGLPIITRSNVDLPFAEADGLMCIDSDSAGQLITPDQVWQALCAAEFALAGYSCLQTTSSSSNVIMGATDTGIRGLHTFLHVKDSKDIPRALHALHVRMMLRGYARHKLSETGSFLPRSFVDQALKVPSQPIYLRAHLIPPVTQNKQVWTREGIELLDTRAVIPDLTAHELAALQSHLAEAEAALKPDMEKQAEVYTTARAKALAQTQGIPEDVARQNVETAMQRRVLMPEFVIQIGTQCVTIADILAEPDKWNGVACCDPLEPDYNKGRTVAKIYTDGQSGRIHSFAHSGGDKGNVFPFWNMPPAPSPVALTDWHHIPLPPIDPSIVAVLGHRPDVTHDCMACELTDVLFGQNARWWTDASKWLLWDGLRWVIDTKMKAWDAVRGYLRAKAAQIKAWVEMHAPTLENPKKSAALLAWGGQTAHNLRQSTTVAALHQMLTLGSQLAVTSDDLDSDVLLLGTPDGVVDLRTGHVRAARREDLITQCVVCLPAPTGTPAPLWDAFLNKVMGGDSDMVSFLQRAIGYALTGSVAEQKFLFMTGGGRNGKGVFLNTVLGMMADYARKAPSNLFIETKTQEHSTGIAGLRGMRFVFGSEIPKGSFWNETALKDMTGGDMLSARFMRGDYFDFMPQFLLAIAANSKPALRDTSQAIRDRLLLVPFDVYIPPDERDTELPDKLQAEWPAILRWAIDGCLLWQRDGLKPPAKVSAASKDYIDGEDFLAQFLDDECEAGGTNMVDVSAFTDRYNSWRQRDGLRPVVRAQVVKEMEQRGYHQSRERLNGSRLYHFTGVRVKPLEMPAAPPSPPSPPFTAQNM